MVKQQRLEATDFTLLTALLWPKASFEKLQILAYLLIWLFTWDDEIDEPNGAFSEDVKAAQNYRAETLQYIRLLLNLRPSENICHPQSQIVRSVDIVCYALCESYTVAQRERFYQEILRFVTASENEQRGRLDGILPTLGEYWNFRRGTSGVHIITAVVEYSMSSDLPDRLINHEAMRAIWDETNMIISITNDIQSLKKEIKHGCVDNIVSLTFAYTDDMQRAVNESVLALSKSKARFGEAADRLLLAATGYEQQVMSFVDVQRSYCVGNLVWR